MGTRRPHEEQGLANPRFNGARQESFLSRLGDSRWIARSVDCDLRERPGPKVKPRRGDSGALKAWQSSGGLLPSSNLQARGQLIVPKKFDCVRYATPELVLMKNRAREAPAIRQSLVPLRTGTYLREGRAGPGLLTVTEQDLVTGCADLRAIGLQARQHPHGVLIRGLAELAHGGRAGGPLLRGSLLLRQGRRRYPDERRS